MRSWLRERKGENIMKQYYKMKVAGCDRELPLCPVNEPVSYTHLTLPTN